MAFHDLNINKLKVEAYQFNLAVKGFCWQLGFTKEAHFKNDSKVNGEPVDVLVYSLTREKYLSQIRRKFDHVLR